MSAHFTRFGRTAADPLPSEPARDLEVLVLFTDIPSTLRALRTAAQLAQGLTARIRLIQLQVVPYPLPITHSPRSLPCLCGRFRTLIDSSSVEGASRSVETTAEIVLCRDAWDGLKREAGKESVIVIGKRGRWWPRMEDRLARRLRAAGHHVIRTSPASGSPTAGFSIKGLAHA